MKSGQLSFTLLEIVVYIGVLSLIISVIVSFFLWTISLNVKSQTSRETLDDARQALDIMIQEIKHSERIYLPTSVLNTHPGQLSLETKRNPPPGETLTHVDFYLNNERIYLKREGSPSIAITPERVKVTSFVFVKLTSLVNPEVPSSVRIALEVRYKTLSTRPGWQSRTAFLSTASTLRSY